MGLILMITLTPASFGRLDADEEETEMDERQGLCAETTQTADMCMKIWKGTFLTLCVHRSQVPPFFPKPGKEKKADRLAFAKL